MAVGTDILPTILLALWSVALLLAGLMIGWRCRAGLSPLPSLPNPFAAKPEPPKKPEAPKQVQI